MKEDRGNLTVPDRRSGESPSGKAAAFGAAIRRFESSLPSHRQRAGASVGQASFRGMRRFDACRDATVLPYFALPTQQCVKGRATL